MLVLAACQEKAPPGPDPAAVAEQSRLLTAYLDAEFEEELAMSPEGLTRQGRKEKQDQLDDYSEAQQSRELEWRRQSVADMKSRFDYKTLSSDAQTSYDMWANELDRAELRARFPRHPYIFGMGGPHTDLPNFLMTYHKVEEPADMDAYIARIAAIGPALDQNIERAQSAAADGIRMPKFNYVRVIAEAKGLIHGEPFDKSAPASALWTDATAKIKALVDSGKATKEQGAAWEKATREALLNKMKPSYDKLVAWLTADQTSAPSGKVGAVTLPDGKNWYAASLKLLTTTDMTPDEIHELGLKEVARIQGEMDKIRVQVGFKGDQKAFFEYMRTDPQFYLPNTDEGRQEYLHKAEGYLDAMKKKLPEYFGRLPKAQLVVKRVEPYREQAGAAAHYFRPTPDGKTPGVFYAHLIDMKAVSVWALESLCYHEGVPGHHMQIAIQGELTDIPKFRTVYTYPAYTEGWGLYAEELGKEMGFFTDPYNEFGRLSSELWRSVRLVADTGLHAKGWTEEEAVAYALANSPRPETAIRSEVRRFLLWPGQATSYKIGMIDIQKLRDEAKKELGAKFDWRGFHDTVIGGGSLPLPILDKRVRAWIADQKKS
jgi:uncharacterized protein (DUF885 family)